MDGADNCTASVNLPPRICPLCVEKKIEKWLSRDFILYVFAGAGHMIAGDLPFITPDLLDIEGVTHVAQITRQDATTQGMGVSPPFEWLLWRCV